MTRAREQEEADCDVSPEEAVEEATKSFNAVHLRLLMKEREDVMKQMLELDWQIWKLEECFRTGP